MKQQTDTRFYDEIQSALDRRYRIKKRTNLVISMAIFVLGVSSFLYGLRLESFRTIFHWMTVDAARC